MKQVKRTELMSQFKMLAKEYDRRDDAVLRNQAAQDWRDLATDEEAQDAPDYLTWNGRKPAN